MDFKNGLSGFGLEYVAQNKAVNLSEVPKKFEELTQIFNEKLQEHLRQVTEGKLSVPAFFYLVKKAAGSFDTFCTNLTFEAINNNVNMSDKEKMLLVELMCGQHWQRGDIIWDRLVPASKKPIPYSPPYGPEGSSINEIVIVQVEGEMTKQMKYVSIIDVKAELRHPLIISESFSSDPVDLELHPNNGVVVFYKGTELNFSVNGNGPDSIRTKVNYNYKR